VLRHQSDADTSHPRVSFSAKESQRFGLRVGRIDVPGNPEYGPAEIVRSVAAENLDFAVVRYPSSFVDWHWRFLSAQPTAIFADTLLYFSKLLSPSQMDGPLQVERVLTVAQQELVAGLAREAFDEYRGHYFANPWVSRRAIGLGYEEWARESADPFATDRQAFLARAEPAPDAVGFACVSTEGDTAEFSLVAVHTDWAGHGFYSGIVDSVGDLLLDQGIATAYISTQVHNTKAVRSILRSGYRPILSLTTVHLVRAGLAAPPQWD
jgi:hypothetical protein